MAMRVRSMVGLIPLFACLTLEDEVIQKLPDFKKRLKWFLSNRQDLAKQVCVDRNDTKKKVISHTLFVCRICVWKYHF